jgi:hypothetical protein
MFLTYRVCMFACGCCAVAVSRFVCTQVLVASCQQEVQEVIRLCTNSRYTDLLFVAHSFEVMRGLPEAGRVISRPLPHMGCDQAENFMLNYAEVRLLCIRVSLLTVFAVC